MKNECCGTCKWSQFKSITEGYFCANSNSEFCTDFTPYNHSCDEWEVRE